MQKIKLQMIQEDINGSDYSSGNCPIARTIKRVLGFESAVGLVNAFFQGNVYRLDEAGCKFVLDLCRHNSPSPVEIELTGW